jgi:hypothetical protein
VGSEHTATRNVREPPRPIQSQSLGRLRRTPGAGRAPAWYPTAFRRRPASAARHGPRRRRWWNFMSRRPEAAYRVIDEEELLGGSGEVDEGHGGPSGSAAASGFEPHVRGRRHGRLRNSWRSTLAAVVGLAGIAAVLLAASSHAPAAKPERPAMMVSRRSSRPDLGAVLQAKAPPRAAGRRPAHRRPRAQGSSSGHATAAHRPGPRNTSADRQRSSAKARRVRVVPAPPQRVTAATAAPLRLSPAATVPAALAETADPASEFGFER